MPSCLRGPLEIGLVVLRTYGAVGRGLRRAQSSDFGELSRAAGRDDEIDNKSKFDETVYVEDSTIYSRVDQNFGAGWPDHGWTGRPDVDGPGRHAYGGTRRNQFAGRGCLRKWPFQCRLCLRHRRARFRGRSGLASARRWHGRAKAGHSAVIYLAFSTRRSGIGNYPDSRSALAFRLSTTGGGTRQGQAVSGDFELVASPRSGFHKLEDL